MDTSLSLEKYFFFAFIKNINSTLFLSSRLGILREKEGQQSRAEKNKT